MTDLNIAEVPFANGQYRYARYLSDDGQRWVRHGLFCVYYEDGTLASEGSYEHGKEEGLWRDFHPNGQLAAEGYYENGIETGCWRSWTEEGVEESARGSE